MLKNENYETSIYSHLTRNKKWKLWVRWHGSSWWLLYLCVLCFVFCAAFKTIQCSWVSPYFIFWKMKIMSFVFLQISSLINLRLEKITKGKKCNVLVFLASVLECHHISYFEKWKLWAMFFGRFLRWWNYDRKKLWQEKKGTMLVYLVLWGNSFWYYLHT